MFVNIQVKGNEVSVPLFVVQERFLSSKADIAWIGRHIELRTATQLFFKMVWEQDILVVQPTAFYQVYAGIPGDALLDSGPYKVMVEPFAVSRFGLLVEIPAREDAVYLTQGTIPAFLGRMSTLKEFEQFGKLQRDERIARAFQAIRKQLAVGALTSVERRILADIHERLENGEQDS